MPPGVKIWTAGHSNHPLDYFLGLLDASSIDVLVDVRSFPYSRFAPHFDRDDLARSVRSSGTSYVFMGDALGGRPTNDDHFDDDGHALYGEMASEPEFKDGIARLLAGASKGRLALMCSCGQPAECHRRLLVGKVLADRGVELVHILPSGKIREERQVAIGFQSILFGEQKPAWRSTQSVSHRRRLSTSSSA